MFMNFKTDQHEEVFGWYQTLYDGIDTLAAICFVAGSALFFFDRLQMPATWLFLSGSLFFLARPGVHFLRDMHLAKLPLPGEDQDR